MKASELDNKFDDNEEVLEHFDLSNAKRPNLTTKRVNIDFLTCIVGLLDNEVSRIGVTRQSLIKLWLADKLAISS
jgi:hypothetical protein